MLASLPKEKDGYQKLMRHRLVLFFLSRYLSRFDGCSHVHQFIISHLVCSHASSHALKSLEEAPQVDAVIVSPEITKAATELYSKIYAKVIDVNSIYSRNYETEEARNRFASIPGLDENEGMDAVRKERGKADAIFSEGSLTNSKVEEVPRKKSDWVQISEDGSKSLVSIESDAKKDEKKPIEEKKSSGFFGGFCNLSITKFPFLAGLAAQTPQQW
jgi:hypothetical protein